MCNFWKSILLLSFVSCLFFPLLFVRVVEAEKRIEFKPQVGIGEKFPVATPREIQKESTLIGQYIAAFYRYFIGAIAIIATVMIMWGGFLWLTAAGSASQIGIAKSRITNALIGLVLALGSYLILNTINPKLVRFQPLTITPIEKKELELAEGGLATAFCSSRGKKHRSLGDECGLKLVDAKGNPCFGAFCTPAVIGQTETCLYSADWEYVWKGPIAETVREIFGGKTAVCAEKLFLVTEERKEEVKFDNEEECGFLIEKDKDWAWLVRFFGKEKKVVVGNRCPSFSKKEWKKIRPEEPFQLQQAYCVINLDAGIAIYTPPEKMGNKKSVLGKYKDQGCYF